MHRRACCLMFVLACMAICWLPNGQIEAADWPQSRFDAGHTSASPEQLAASLHLHWRRELPTNQSAWLDQPKLTFDVGHDPIVLANRMYVASARHDCVVAMDLETGNELWRFFAEGPVRLTPVGWEGRLFITSDDGFLYCVDAVTGDLRWKFRGGPADRLVLGNERLVSAWPARGGAVVADDTVYFAASIWPFMGVFVHALDARTGEVRWTNDGDGSLYMKQPHSTDSFASVAPQGTLAIAGQTLLVPGGRSIPACYDRRTGKLLRYLLNDNNRKGGGSDVAAESRFFVNGDGVFEVETEKFIGGIGRAVVLDRGIAYALRSSECVAYDTRPTPPKPEKTSTEAASGSSLIKKISTTGKQAFPEIGVCKVPVSECLVKGGNRLYVGGKNRIAAIEFPTLSAAETSRESGVGKKPNVVWETAVDGTVFRLAIASGRLIATTREGHIYCFGAEDQKPRDLPLEKSKPLVADDAAKLAKQLLKASRVSQGYGIVLGENVTPLTTALATQSPIQWIALESKIETLSASRSELVASDLYGRRVALLGGTSRLAALPPYLASLAVVTDWAALTAARQDSATPSTALEVSLRRLFEVLRPYGGTACLAADAEQAREIQSLVASWPQATVKIENGWVLLRKEGALPGAANWTHEHADAANTRVSRDQLVKAPLGLLWFGGATNDAILPRHGHGPQPQVVDGRMIVEGMDLLRALDIYTGRVLWEASLPGVGAFFNNLAHQPGANATGTNYVSTSDGIYVVLGHRCIRLNPETGKRSGEFRLPQIGMKSGGKKEKESPRWGYINVAGDWLIGGADPILDPEIAKQTLEAGKLMSTDDKPIDSLLKVRWKAMMFNDNLSASRHLVVMDRQTGKVAWTVSAEHSFRHNATCIGGGRLYTIDRPTASQIDRLKKQGVDVAAIKPKLLVFDLETGKPLWNKSDEVFGTWLSYSEKHDVLVESGRNARDTLLDEPKGMRTYRGGSGETIWTNMSYVGPAIIHGDMILRDTKACDLLTGAPRMRPDPITGKSVEWSWSRNYGCNTPAASEHLLTFRSGAAGFFDLCHDGGTGNLGGFRSSCTNNLIVAGGVLAAPDYTRTCTCSYQNQTSIGLVHMPDLEMWTMFGTSTVRGAVKNVGLNFGAPGDRRTPDGTLWLEYPSSGGPSPSVAVTTVPEKPAMFRRHESQVAGESNWVGASGFRGVSKISIALDTNDKAAYMLKLIFAEPELATAGQRRFHVAINGNEVLHDFDIVKEAGGPRRTIIKEFGPVTATEFIHLEFTADQSSPVPETVISGIQIRAEKTAGNER